jgi:hypothetical protein
MYLEDFMSALKRQWSGSLFTVRSTQELNKRAKEYLHRLIKTGKVMKVHWGWYYLPEKKDPWQFLARDRGFKVVIKQSAASIWNYDFIHRDILRLAVADHSYKKALEDLGKKMGWNFEVEYHTKMSYDYTNVDGLHVQTFETCIVDCIADWAFTDAFATLYYRGREIDYGRLRESARWKRVSNTATRVWQIITYGCSSLNKRLRRIVCNVRDNTSIPVDMQELTEEAIDKVVELA